MDLKLILGCVFTVVCALIAAVYKEPKSYDVLMKPVLSRIAGWSFLIGTGMLIGHMVVSNTLFPFVDPSRLDAATKAIADSKELAYVGQVFAGFIWLVDIGLWVLADKAEKLKNKE